ncbi:hypothetical protein A6V39_00945 [Candidatus Mycoplasma haematobovis]|uniref:Uncharacterized protein n=1 Tax=Candidatus Mycoplasma haematobovis TaxID=432608 RepID=A0A1A9QFX4_9MOLU|nr:hypothetical protein [Candidatus Mycoplasma haematobovis]OAL10619.1 hypothetical protein A6V39_00945 [Candidatus Mycoplasma haematobovis]
MASIKIDKTLKNMVVIGGTVSTVAFGFSMVSSKASMNKSISLGYPTSKWTPNVTNIDSVDNIEDLELQKGCKFVFYNKSEKQTAFSGGLVKDARNYLNGVSDESKKQKIIEEVRRNKDNCNKDGFIYIELE